MQKYVTMAIVALVVVIAYDMVIKKMILKSDFEEAFEEVD